MNQRRQPAQTNGKAGGRRLSGQHTAPLQAAALRELAGLLRTAVCARALRCSLDE